MKQTQQRKLVVSEWITLVQALLQAKLVDEMRFLIHPVTVGAGKRIFQEGAPTTRLELVDTKRLSSGAIVLCYRPTR